MGNSRDEGKGSKIRAVHEDMQVCIGKWGKERTQGNRVETQNFYTQIYNSKHWKKHTKACSKQREIAKSKRTRLRNRQKCQIHNQSHIRPEARASRAAAPQCHRQRSVWCRFGCICATQKSEKMKGRRKRQQCTRMNRERIRENE